MTPLAQRLVIAEACGWVYCGSDSCTPWYLSPQDAPLYSADPKPWREIETRRRQLPNYPNDLNAMKEAEAWMFNNKGLHFSRGYYETHLPNAVNGADGCWACVSATAAQRAEAFLRTIGKWEESA